MCGQENKKMSVQDVVVNLTKDCIELRQQLRSISDISEKETIVLKHIKDCTKVDIHANDFHKASTENTMNEQLKTVEMEGNCITVIESSDIQKSTITKKLNTNNNNNDNNLLNNENNEYNCLVEMEKILDDELIKLKIELEKGTPIQETMDNLHRYNDIKDATQIVLGAIATMHGITIASLHNEYDVPLNEGGLEWFNISNELSITEHLTGKIIILDFFTYCCINCMHILPDLSALESKYTIKDGLVVIGIHSAKFSNEKNSDKILSAIQRYNIGHPVVNDDKLSMWHDMGISCWPTLIILGPKAQLLFVLMGEGHRNELFTYVKVALNHFKSLNQISNHEISLSPAHHLLPQSKDVLLFPGKIQSFVTPNGEKIIISDTGNNRIIIMNIDGSVVHVIGGYLSGFTDGEYDKAQFNAPQGICILNNSIYIADTGNHAIRHIDMGKKIVTTLVGNGSQGNDYTGGNYGRMQTLSSPWDVAIYYHSQDKKKIPIVLIANAGTHQIWALFLHDTIWWKKKEYKAGTCAAIVGNGREENRNNSYPHAACLAQPSGLAVAQEINAVFFADSESSAIRRVDLQDGKVSGVAGGDKNPSNLHCFGDADGIKYSAKFQHPLGITWDSSEFLIYVADTYNHKIKCVKLDGTCETLCGNGKPTNNHSFNEPSGLAMSTKNASLLITDTNNHCIKILNKIDQSIRTIRLTMPKYTATVAEKTFNFVTELNNDKSKLIILLDIDTDSSLKLTPNAPHSWTLNSLPSTWIADHLTGDIKSPIIMSIPDDNSPTKITIRLNLLVCNDNKCIPKSIDAIFNIERKREAPNFLKEFKNLKIN